MQLKISILIFFSISLFSCTLETNKIDTISKDDIPNVVEELYTLKKDHIQVFVKDSLKIMLKPAILLFVFTFSVQQSFSVTAAIKEIEGTGNHLIISNWV